MAAGAVCMLLRYFGAYEEGACFAVLLMNATWPMVDGLLQGRKEKQRKGSSAAASGLQEGGEAHA